MRMIRAMFLLLLSAAALLGQDFHSAVVRKSVPVADAAAAFDALHGGQVEIQRASLADLIGLAYGVHSDVVSGGPEWIDWDRFDVSAESSSDTPSDVVRAMLRSLLAQRFGLAVHAADVPVSGFILSPGKSARGMHPASSAGSGCSAAHLQAGPISQRHYVASCRGITMRAFAETLAGIDKRYVDGPVVDQTGLGGAWDFDLTWNDRRDLPLAGSEGVRLFDALEKQLGLKVMSGRVPMYGIVVDRVNPNPILDAPRERATAKAFEVASIRQSLPGTPPGRRLIEPGGRVEMRGAPLFLLILQAWKLNIDPEGELPGRPKWLTPFSPSFDLVAKEPAGFVSEDDFSEMLRSLVIERFKMATHYEDRPAEAYSLVASKPKLTRGMETSGRAVRRSDCP